MRIPIIVRSLVQSRRYKNFCVSSGILLTLYSSFVPVVAQETIAPLPPLESGSVLTDANYTVGPGDRILISLFQEENYTGEHIIAVDGTVSLPLVGNLKVSGLSLAKITELVTQKYAQYLKRPVVTLKLIAARPLKISVIGEVQKPGSYEITFQENQQFPTVTRLLELSGGITISADIRQIQIQRNIDGKKEVLIADLWNYLQQGDESQNIILRDGDIIFVPTANQIDMAQANYLDDVTFGIQAPEAINVAVIGEVYRPGTYTIESEQTTPKSATITEAIQLAGGIKPLADIRQIEVRRQTRNGSQQTFKVDLWELLKTGDTNKDIILQKGDTVVIPTANQLTAAESSTLATASFAPTTIRVNVVGEVNNPGLIEVAPNTPLNQAILAAGGFNAERSKKNSVELIRLNPDGTVSKKDVSIDLASGINETNNPILRNDDVIIVKRSNQASVSDGLGMLLTPLQFIFPFLRFLDNN
ncbi:polysaccharide export protein [Gloeothece citriformis PCC 7424]|uniref:Polysaccharide export protein n=1 Tax=Gloeothece citriformis (strain PCC 7424) TaxID=65393 RepID=B7KBI5_GLOC7|nr:SLBB domain-containing protein [Gloeothece citriformis]ACK72963.1 polysaccharide export protein [Gloeothece citriformis PCC 7424]